MPYFVKRVKAGDYVIVKKEPGGHTETVSHHATRTKARAAIRAIESHIHGK